MDRRHFIASSAVLAGALMSPFPVRSLADKINLAILGTGHWGTEVLLKSAIASGQFEIVALCDVNTFSLNNAAEIAMSVGVKKPNYFHPTRRCTNCTDFMPSRLRHLHTGTLCSL